MSRAIRPWSEHLRAGVAAADVDLADGGTLPQRWAALAAAEPDRPALHAAGAWHTRGALAEGARDRAGRLQAAGIGPGDRVLLRRSSSLDLVLDHLAILHSGATVLPTNPDYTARELAHIVGDARPALALCDTPEGRAMLTAPDPALRVHATLSELDPATPLDEPLVKPGAPAMILYTSGTTGAPKGAVLSHANILAGALGVLLAWRWTPEDRLALALPLFHMHGVGVGLHGTMAAGASAVLIERFSPEAVFAAIAEHDATLVFGVPTMYHRLADAEGAEALRGLRLCVSGSAPLPPELFARLLARTGQVPLERYGMTETLMNLSNPYDGERKPGSVGFPLPGVEMRIDTTDGSGEGEILLRGPNVFAGYWERPEATAAAFTEDGYFRTGDIGTVDADGDVAIVGRASETIISGGFNVYPREVEEVLAEAPGVREVAVTGTPSEEWGEVVTAYVVASDPPPDPDALAAWAGERLARYKQPRIVHLVDALPRNALGKVVRSQLRPPA